MASLVNLTAEQLDILLKGVDVSSRLSDLFECISYYLSPERYKESVSQQEVLLTYFGETKELDKRKSLLLHFHERIQNLSDVRRNVYVNCCLQLASIEEEQGQYEAAIPFLKEVENVMVKDDENEQILLVRLRIADNYMKTKQYDKAAMLLRTSIQYLNREKNEQLVTDFLFCNARTLDETHQYGDAALNYSKVLDYESRLQDPIVSECVRMTAICIFLSQPTTELADLLLKLYVHPLSKTTDIYPMLKKCARYEILDRKDATRLLPCLAAHQVTFVQDIMLAQKNVFLELNIALYSRNYLRASIPVFAKHLCVSPAALQYTLIDMIKDQRLNAHIDQVNGIVTFHDHTKAGIYAKNLERLCENLEKYGC
ncbi:COP9/signalosome complex subunit Csn4 [Schizosaccharomyces japonicus yFS275]|uniref:COP9/signalosome complex subunit Csn4 n=1 Tax=Schizosaccharomyces japonicus (strain yFS275 / FY16936) TaxID=402676 RepID=B6K2T5_SCHJY|nr:COP9/signalosome complex subunit Csn4 [Schizosaccharomyces japonicus yFS275]EEB08575.1 COP9/signalosome complex subunit Csn4 [Schizosaccharomyces japonicus yFS275]